MTGLAQLKERLEELRAGDLPTKGGRTLAYVYDSGLEDVDELARAAMAAYADSNGLDPTVFPSLMTMENELVGFAADMLGAPATTVGSVTSGGTESCLLAVQAARDARPDVERPRMVLPSTVHAAFRKGAHYFGVEPVVVPVGEDHRAVPGRMAEAIDERTVLVVASAPSYAHGVVDPVGPIAAAAAEREVRCHVDACIGGWVLPHAARLGRPVPAWGFDVPGVTSISVDLHKYAYTPKGASILLHRTPELRRPQFFASADWPGYTMLNATMQSTKSGAPLAAAWAVVHAIGHDGYERLAATAFGAVDRLVEVVADTPGLRVVVPPDSTLVAAETDGSCDVFTIADEMAATGWYVQPQMTYEGQPPTLHLTVSAATADRVDEFAEALGHAVRRAQASGPVAVDAGVADVIGALDPATLSEADFDVLLEAAGLAGDEGMALPERMAEVNALLDLAPPRLREVVMVSFLDRLMRPTRP